MPTVRDTADLLRLKAKIEGLPIDSRLMFVGALVQENHLEIAEILLSNIVDELRALRLFKNRKIASAPHQTPEPR
jgi:hypothetical protein